MKFYYLLCLLIVQISGRVFDIDFFDNIDQSDDVDESIENFNVVPKENFRIYSKDDDTHSQYQIGQVSGIASNVKNPNRLFIFHRGSRKWTIESFPDGKHFDRNKFSPIEENLIIQVDTRNGQIIDQWGNKTFSMPHGLSIDTEGNIWLTDVAMHQVFKYSNGKLLLTLGELFVPGNDKKHFCKPTDVAVSNDGSNIFVADGYCNSRIVQFDSKGNYLTEYKMNQDEKQLNIPHSLTLIELLNLICVADRENGRIVCFDTSSDQQGEVKAIIKHPLMKTVYALTYDPIKHRLYVVSGNPQPLGFTFSAHPDSFGEFISTWKPKHNFGEPHDIALSVNGRSLYVGEINPNRIDSFDIIN